MPSVTKIPGVVGRPLLDLGIFQAAAVFQIEKVTQPPEAKVLLTSGDRFSSLGPPLTTSPSRARVGATLGSLGSLVTPAPTRHLKKEDVNKGKDSYYID